MEVTVYRAGQLLISAPSRRQASLESIVFFVTRAFAFVLLTLAVLPYFARPCKTASELPEAFRQSAIAKQSARCTRALPRMRKFGSAPVALAPLSGRPPIRELTDSLRAEV